MSKTFAGLTVRQATEESPAGISMAIYGAPGVGKTTLAAQASLSEYGGRVLFLDAEGGTRSISHLDNVDVIDIHDWAQFGKVTNVLANPNEACEWGTIVLDNMSEYQAVNLKHIVGKDIPQIQHWGQSTNDMLYVTRLYRDLARKRGFNVFYIVWEAPEKDEASGIIKRDVGFTPSLARQFPGIIDIVAYLTVEADQTRVLSFAPSPRTAAKFRRSRSEAARDIPLVLYYNAEDLPMIDLLATLKGGQAWPTGKYTRKTQQQGQSK